MIGITPSLARRSMAVSCAAAIIGTVDFRGAFAADSWAASRSGWLTAELGGSATLAIANENAYARPIPTLPTEQLRPFTFGNRVFNTNWVIAPASVDGFDGVGPVFNRVSCSSCHTRDGRGQPPREESSPLESMLIRLSGPGLAAPGGPKPLPAHGDQVDAQAM